MKILNNIKKTIAIRKLRKLISESNHKPIVCNITHAKSIGIIYEATDEREFKIVRDFVSKLKETTPEVASIGYVDKKDLDGFHIQPIEFGFFCKKDLNWYGKPKHYAVSDFTDKKFDILIDLQLAEIIPLRFILAQSNAKFKVGRKPVRLEEFYDLMLEVKPYVALKYFIEQTVHYLKIIK